MNTIVDFLNTIFWGYVLIYGLLAVGVYFTVRLRFQQILRFGEMFRVITSAPETDKEGISPFQALCTSLASRVGTGNIAGVAVALNLGGPGAIFWMWMVALVGMATAYSESTLAQLYKVHEVEGGGTGVYRGGPAFYIAKGLGMPWMGAAFSFFLILTFGLVFNAVQANSIADAMVGAFGIPKLATGLVLAAITAVVIFGGIRQIATVAEYLVPFMAGAYLLLALLVLVMNIGEVPGMLWNIVGNAFGFAEAAGGVTGGVAAAMLNGVRRGLFSNEAGMGSAPNAAATATVSHPAKQGLVQSLGVFVDTMVVCSATAFMILLAGPTVYDPGTTTEAAGGSLTQAAVAHVLGDWTIPLMTVLIFVFAFSSVLGNYSYAEVNLTYLGVRGRALTALRTLVLAAVGIGALVALETAWAVADVAMAFMAIINLVAISLLGRWAFGTLRDYERRTREGGDDRFVATHNPDLPGELPGDVWAASHGERQDVAAR